jgi:hypothetical protein
MQAVSENLSQGVRWCFIGNHGRKADFPLFAVIAAIFFRRRFCHLKIEQPLGSVSGRQMVRVTRGCLALTLFILALAFALPRTFPFLKAGTRAEFTLLMQAAAKGDTHTVRLLLSQPTVQVTSCSSCSPSAVWT